jgi:predicted RNA-binding Zn ribbon-like protein
LFNEYESVPANVYEWPPSPRKGLIEKFNKVLRESFSHIHLDVGNAKNEVSFGDLLPSFHEPLYVVLKSAYDVLMEEDQTRVKECPSCGWLFLDGTKNKKRRWCNMLVCGS